MKSEFTYDPSWNQDREEEEDKPEINSNDRFEYEKSKYGGSEFSGTDTDYHRRKPIFDDPPKKKTEVQFKSSTLQTVVKLFILITGFISLFSCRSQTILAISVIGEPLGKLISSNRDLRRNKPMIFQIFPTQTQSLQLSNSNKPQQVIII